MNMSLERFTSTFEVSAIRSICRTRHAEDKVETIHGSLLDPLKMWRRDVGKSHQDIKMRGKLLAMSVKL